MKAKLDENLGSLGADFLRAAGIDVVTVADQGLRSAPDRTILGVCAAEDRCVITLDTDFANPLHYQPRDYAGIVLVRCPAGCASLTWSARWRWWSKRPGQPTCAAGCGLPRFTAFVSISGDRNETLGAPGSGASISSSKMASIGRRTS